MGPPADRRFPGGGKPQSDPGRGPWKDMVNPACPVHPLAPQESVSEQLHLGDAVLCLGLLELSAHPGQPRPEGVPTSAWQGEGNKTQSGPKNTDSGFGGRHLGDAPWALWTQQMLSFLAGSII